MSFRDLLQRAQEGDEAAIERLIHMYRPLLSKLSCVADRFDEDLYQEQVICFMKCIKSFSENYTPDCDIR